jgi:hypothetical protein
MRERRPDGGGSDRILRTGVPLELHCSRSRGGVVDETRRAHERGVQGVEDRARVLHGRLRSGELPEWQIVRAANMGDPAAKRLVETARLSSTGDFYTETRLEHVAGVFEITSYRVGNNAKENYGLLEQVPTLTRLDLSFASSTRRAWCICAPCPT